MNNNNIKVLIVDDSELNIAVLTKYLEDSGFQVTSCLHGSEIESMVLEESFDVVLLDYYIGETLGVDLVKKVRKHRTKDELKIFMVTSIGNEELIENCMTHGANGFIPKPYNQKQIEKKIIFSFMKS